MKKSMVFICASLIAVGLAFPAGHAAAAIVYLDATDGAGGNTAIAPSAGGGVWTTNGTDTAEGIWRLRTGFGLAPTATTVPTGAFDAGSGTVYESSGNVSPSDDVPRLVTTKSGLAAGVYEVYTFFWADQNGSPWRIRTGLTDSVDPLPLFVGGGAPSGSPLPIDTGGRDGAGRILWRASVGQATGSSISVYVEDAPATSGNERTWYDGIGYERVVPEPTSFALLALGLVMLLNGRRKTGLVA
jgi:PEP-CTERM motif